MSSVLKPQSSALAFPFDNSYARDLPGFYVAQRPAVVPMPKLLYFNETLATDLGLDLASLDAATKAAIFAGNIVPQGAEPIAQAYAGHQFGGFSPRLGDGRALLLGEVIDRSGQRRDIAFKGSGRTPFARGGDGKAAIGPMLREALVSEAMHALGIPTTRALAVAATGEQVFRERVLPGAVLTRVASSHIRVGTFQYYASRGEFDNLRKLADYTIARHDAALAGTEQRYLGFLRNVAERQAKLVAQWMNVGFIHGVMNTDNMTNSGETIDYGPCAFIEAYDPATVFSSIDENGRYAYGNQPRIAYWNLARLAESLLPLIHEDGDEAVAIATEALSAFPGQYERALLRGQRLKLGLLPDAESRDEADASLAEDWLALLQANRVDFTLGWRRLADAAEGNDGPLQELFANNDTLNPWLARWRERCASESGGDHASPGATLEASTISSARAERMRSVNPYVIPRNHRVEEALTAASERDDLQPFENLLEALRHPFDEAPERAAYAEPALAAVTASYQTFCGT